MEWNKGIHVNAVKKIVKVKVKLEQLRIEGSSDKSKLFKLKSELNNAYKEEELSLPQKSKVKWLQVQYKIFSFFHASVASRRKRNNLYRLQNEDGNWCKNEAEIGKVIKEFYKNIFTSSCPHDFNKVLAGIPRMITQQMNKELTKPFDESENCTIVVVFRVV